MAGKRPGSRKSVGSEVETTEKKPRGGGHDSSRAGSKKDTTNKPTALPEAVPKGGGHDSAKSATKKPK
jgi:hypothetical protein